jgi:hypothetical protein
MTWRRWIGWAFAAALLMTVLSSCGSSSTPMGPGRMEMVISLTPDGGADVRIKAAEPIASDAQLQDLAAVLVQAVFGGNPDMIVQASGDNYTFARTHVDKAFRTGAHPTYRFDGTELRKILAAHRITGARLRLEAPAVPATARTDGAASWDGGAAEWDLDPAGTVPRAELRMSPRPVLWGVDMTITLAAFGCLAAALLRRERARRVTVLTALSVAGCVTAVGMSFVVRADDAGVAGLVNENGLLIVALLPLVALFVGAGALYLLVRTVVWRYRADRPPRRSRQASGVSG